MIGAEFWNFVAKSEEGGKVIFDEFIKFAPIVDKSYAGAVARMKTSIN